MAETAGLRAKVLEAVKARGPISVVQICKVVAAEDKPIRTAIDALRDRGEPIWLDAQLGFWWRDDQQPSPVPGNDRWKRPYSPASERG